MEMVLKTVKRERSLREVRWGGRPDLGGRPAFQVQEMGERVALPRKERRMVRLAPRMTEDLKCRGVQES